MKCFMRIAFVLVLLGALVTGYTSVQADQVPILLSHQGRLLDASDAPVTNGVYPMRFSLWTDSISGTEVWFELQDVSVQKGLFNTYLGRSTNLSPVADQYAATQPLFLQTQVTINGGVVVLSPRLRIATVPLAARALRLAGDTISGSGHSIFTNTAQGGSTEMRVLSLNGLPPGTPVTGAMLSSTTDSAIVDASTYDNGVLASEYKAKAGKTGATKRLIFVSGSTGTSSLEHADNGSTGAEYKSTVSGTKTITIKATASLSDATTENTYEQGNDDLSTVSTADADSATFSSSASKFGELKSIVAGTTSLQGSSGAHSRLAIKTKGTSAQRSSLTIDADDDGAAASSVAMRAINTKGTGATVRFSSEASDSGAISILDVDTDGNGIAEAMIHHQATADSVVDEQSYAKGSQQVIYHATTGKSGATKRTTNQNGSSSSSSSEVTDADSIVYADSLFDTGQPKATYKATQGKTGSAKQSRIYNGGDESETNERSTVDSSVTDETYHHNGGLVAQYTAKTGKTGKTKRMMHQDGSDQSTSSETADADSITTADTVSNGGGSQYSAYGAKQGSSGRTKDAKIVDGDDESSSQERSYADSTVNDGTYHHGGALAAQYTAKQGKTGSAKSAKIVDDEGDESSSSERSYADSSVSDDTYSHGGAIAAQYTAKAGKSGKFKNSLVVSGDDGTSESENNTVDSLTHDESVTVNNIVVTQYTAKQGSSGRTKRTIHNTGTIAYASSEDVDNNGARMYMTTDDGNPGTPPDTGFYVDNNGNLRLSGNGTYGVEIRGTGARLGIGVQSPSHPLALASGAHCTAGGVFTNASDVNLKENFKLVDDAAILDKVEQLPISQWNYKNESDEVTHIGPTAQDFKAIFGVGDNDKSISTIDPAGIALAAIKELRKENRDLKGENVELKKRLDDLQKKVEALLQK